MIRSFAVRVEDGEIKREEALEQLLRDYRNVATALRRISRTSTVLGIGSVAKHATQALPHVYALAERLEWALESEREGIKQARINAEAKEAIRQAEEELGLV